MRPYFTRERFGRPQFLAGMLLLAFFAQCAWLVRAELTESSDLDAAEAIRIREGWKQWHGRGIAGAPFDNAVATAAINNAAGDPAPVSEGEAPSAPSSSMRYPGQDKDGFDAEHSPLLPLASAAPLLVW